MKISVIIPNFNGEKILKKNFPSVIDALKEFAENANTCEVIYIDDGSTDNSIDVLKTLTTSNKIRDISVHVLKNEQNLGFSSTVNKGVAHAGGDIVVLLNTDVIPRKDFLMPLLSHFEDETVFAVGCLDESIEGGKTVKRGRGVGKWWKGFLMHSAGTLDKSDTLWVSCGSGAFRRSIWEKLGGLHEIYNPFYWEDIDLSYRAIKAGYTVLFEGKSIVIHEHEKGAVKSSSSQKKVAETAYRNQFFFVWINITNPLYLFQHILWMPYHMATAKNRGDREFFQGFKDARSSIRKILYLRKRIKHFSKRSDPDILHTYSK